MGAMLKLDDRHAHSFWGTTPPVDLLAVYQHVRGARGANGKAAASPAACAKILQVWKPRALSGAPLHPVGHC